MGIDKVIKSTNFIYNLIKINDNIFPLKRYVPFGEYQLGKRGLYYNINTYSTRNFSSDNIKDGKKQLYLLKNILSYADGKNDILSIANKTKLPIEELNDSLKICLKNKLIKEIK